MKELPRFNTYIKRFGIKPENRDYSNKYTLIGFDTETIGNNDINIKKDIYSMQLVKNSLNEEYFYLVGNDENNLSILDEKTESGQYLFNRHSYITAHNLDFDLGALLGDDYLKICSPEKYQQNGIKFQNGHVLYKDWKIKYALDQTTFFEFKKKDTKIIFTDSMNFFKGSLDMLGKEYFNMEKLKKPVFLGIRPPETDEEFLEFKNYAMQDARIQFLLTKKISDMHKIDNVRLTNTPASLTWRSFRKNYLKDRLFLENNLDKLKLIWSTYHGAVFCAFGRGYYYNKNMYDVNSLYPYSMHESPMNFSNSKYQYLKLDDVENGYYGFCRTKFKFPKDTLYPNLPVRSDKLYFPLEGISYCTTMEIKKALDLGAELSDIKILGWYPKEEDINHPIKKFVADNYKTKKLISEKLEKCKDYEEYKILMTDYLYTKLKLNTLYGRLAQRNDVYDQDLKKYVEIMGSSFKPDFASLITGYSRNIIHNYIMKFNAIYCDTDSIITDKKLPSDLELGGMKLEYENLNFLIVRSKVYFGINNEDKVKKCGRHGFRLTNQNIKKSFQDNKGNLFSTNDDIFNFIKKHEDRSNINYDCIRMTKTKESIKSRRITHNKPRKWVSDNFTIKLDADNKRTYYENLKTSKELFSRNTFSEPLKIMQSIY